MGLVERSGRITDLGEFGDERERFGGSPRRGGVQDGDRFDEGARVR
jgi:hypothetical protein